MTWFEDDRPSCTVTKTPLERVFKTAAGLCTTYPPYRFEEAGSRREIERYLPVREAVDHGGGCREGLAVILRAAAPTEHSRSLRPYQQNLDAPTRYERQDLSPSSSFPFDSARLSALVMRTTPDERQLSPADPVPTRYPSAIISTIYRAPSARPLPSVRRRSRTRMPSSACNEVRMVYAENFFAITFIFSRKHGIRIRCPEDRTSPRYCGALKGPLRLKHIFGIDPSLPSTW